MGADPAAEQDELEVDDCGQGCDAVSQGVAHADDHGFAERVSSTREIKQYGRVARRVCGVVGRVPCECPGGQELLHRCGG